MLTSVKGGKSPAAVLGRGGGGVDLDGLFVCSFDFTPTRNMK